MVDKVIVAETQPDEPKTSVNSIITEHTITAGTVGAGSFLLTFADAPFVYGIWGTMFYRIAKMNGQDLTNQFALKVAAGIGSSISAYYIGSKLLTWLANLIPGIGQLGAGAANMVLNAWFTRSLGRCFDVMLKEHDINGKTVYEITKMCLQYFVPIPQLSELKEVFELLKRE